MTDDMRDRIERLQLYERNDDRADAIDYRADKIDRWGEQTVRRLEDIFLNPDGPEGISATVIDINESDDGLTPRRQLDSLVSTGRWPFTRETFVFREPEDCPDAVFRGDQKKPFFDNPASGFDNVAWKDVCTTPNSWVRLMVSPFDNPPGRSLFNGLLPSSVESVRDGIQSGAVLPPGFVEFEQRNVASFGNVIEAVAQEGRNRGVAAYLEGVDSVLGRLVAHK